MFSKYELNYVKKPPTLYSLITAKYPDIDKITDLVRYGAELLFKDLNTFEIDEYFYYYFQILFVSHFFTRRIGFDTLLAFKIQLQSKLNIVFPKYNILINTFKENNKFSITDTTVKKSNDTRDIITENETTGDSQVNTNTDTIHSDTPQSRLDLVKSGDYATDVTYIENINKGSDKTKSKGQSNNKGVLNEDIKHETINTLEIYKVFIDSKSQYLLNDLLKEFDCLFYQLV